MQDIASKIGVSKVTVSKALSDKDGVSDELKKKIKELADDLGYRYNAQASAIKSGLTHNVGVIVAEHFIDNDYNAFYFMMYQKLSVELDSYHYSAIMHTLNEDDERNLILPKSYYARKIDAYIVLGQVSKEYLAVLNECDVPIVFLDFYDENAGVDSVCGDNFYGAYNVTNHLISKGHHDIAYVGSIKATSSILDRYLGYYKSLLEHGIILNPAYVIEDRDEKGTYVPFVLPSNMPTAFVCNCDRVAYMLIEQLRELGHSVPEDISVVGYDNDIYSTLCKPPLTTVDANVQEMTATAAKVIVEKVKEPSKTFGRMLVKGNVIYRESVTNS
jgi:LacI family transcriptional regulator